MHCRPPSVHLAVPGACITPIVVGVIPVVHESIALDGAVSNNVPIHTPLLADMRGGVLAGATPTAHHLGRHRSRWDVSRNVARNPILTGGVLARCPVTLRPSVSVEGASIVVGPKETATRVTTGFEQLFVLLSRALSLPKVVDTEVNATVPKRH
eukprot:CAMPEP_0194478486 /NCGR_PEP_ID=MMETSP0253-20130528/1913_1 /TAXON_ID=2966 /ORGANISM="Noctiluca scintillans" /LENGTH=153 /DNA_ID=CAMNT_0039317579 /DNA_START=173 /DNA_END=634 /DNA_ORIENTATION=+